VASIPELCNRGLDSEKISAAQEIAAHLLKHSLLSPVSFFGWMASNES